MLTDVCKVKYALTLLEQESRSLTEQMAHYNSLDQSKLWDFTSAVDLGGQLLHQYKQIALEATAELFELYRKSIQEEKTQYTIKHDDLMKEMWWSYHSDDVNHQMSVNMIELIDKRCQVIQQRLQCIYDFKKQSESL